MGALIPNRMQEKFDNKKRKVRIAMDNKKKDSESFLKLKGKGLKSPLILKRSTCSNNVILEVVVDLMDLTRAGKLLVYLCLMIDFLKKGTM